MENIAKMSFSPRFDEIENHHKHILNNVIEIFKDSFDADIVESVLEKRAWDADEAVNDLILMKEGTQFEIPLVDDLICLEPTSIDQSEAGPNTEVTYHETRCDDDRTSNVSEDSDDDVIVVNEVEFQIPVAESESEPEPEVEPKHEPDPILDPIPDPKPELEYSKGDPMPDLKPELECGKDQSTAIEEQLPITHFTPSVSTFSCPTKTRRGTTFQLVQQCRDSIERVKLYVRNELKIMVLMRGLPGCGKSTLARMMVEDMALKSAYVAYVHSTDHYFFLNSSQIYKHDLTKLSDAHNWNKVNVMFAARHGLTPIIVDNTNITFLQMEPYVQIAMAAGYELEIIEPSTSWAFDLQMLAKKNHHNVDAKLIARWRSLYQPNASPLRLMREFQLRYEIKPPQRGTTVLRDQQLIAFFEGLQLLLTTSKSQLKKNKKAKTSVCVPLSELESEEEETSISEKTKSDNEEEPDDVTTDSEAEIAVSTENSTEDSKKPLLDLIDFSCECDAPLEPDVTIKTNKLMEGKQENTDAPVDSTAESSLGMQNKYMEEYRLQNPYADFVINRFLDDGPKDGAISSLLDLDDTQLSLIEHGGESRADYDESHVLIDFSDQPEPESDQKLLVDIEKASGDDGFDVSKNLWSMTDDDTKNNNVCVETKKPVVDSMVSSDSDDVESMPEILDVHNSVNRFVNNDISISHNLRKSLKPELNTLKEKILLSGLDRLLCSPENNEWEIGRSKTTNLSRQSSGVPDEGFVVEHNDLQVCEDNSCARKQTSSKSSVSSEKTEKNLCTSIRLVNDISESHVSALPESEQDDHFLAVKTDPKINNTNVDTGSDKGGHFSNRSTKVTAKGNVELDERWTREHELQYEYYNQLTKGVENDTKDSQVDFKLSEAFTWSPSADAVNTWCSTPSISGCTIKPQRMLDKGINTGIDEPTVSVRDTRARSILSSDYVGESLSVVADRSSRFAPTRSQGTMTEGDGSMVKVQPSRVDLLSMFGPEMAPMVEDYWSNCKGDVEWMIEAFIEGGYEVTGDQLDYLIQLRDVPMAEMAAESTSKKNSKKVPNTKLVRREKRRQKKNSKNKENCSPAALSTQSIDVECPPVEQNTSVDRESSGTISDSPEENVDLFLDSSTVRQLEGYFGNPTIIDMKDFHPVISVPISLARQLHAHLIESMIDQVQKTNDLIKQSQENDLKPLILPVVESNDPVELSDVMDMERQLSSVLMQPLEILPDEKNEASCSSVAYSRFPIQNESLFSSKLSYAVLTDSFPTVDRTFVLRTLKECNFNYQETVNILRTFGDEVQINVSKEEVNERKNKLLMQIQNGKIQGNESNYIENDNIPTDVTLRLEFYRNLAAKEYQGMKECSEKIQYYGSRGQYSVASYYGQLLTVRREKYIYANTEASAALIETNSKSFSETIDLHFLSVSEAMRALSSFLDHHIERLVSTGQRKIYLYIITGRGVNSRGGSSKLIPPVDALLRRRNIEIIPNWNPGMFKICVRRNALLSSELQ